jgi:hypothetical protein
MFSWNDGVINTTGVAGITYLYFNRVPLVSTTLFSRELGNKQYEMEDHLGNVLATVSDRKLPVPLTGASGDVDYFNSDLLGGQLYYPYGMQMPNRVSTATNRNLQVRL